MSAGRAAAAALRSLARLLERLSDDVYADAEPGQSSIGAHVRHLIEHTLLFYDGRASGLIGYDRRTRPRAMERDRKLALMWLEGCSQLLDGIADRELCEPVRVCFDLALDQGETEVGSTVGRELCFLHGHTLHHSALIARLAASRGATLPLHFGEEPSTLRARASARSGVSERSDPALGRKVPARG